MSVFQSLINTFSQLSEFMILTVIVTLIILVITLKLMQKVNLKDRKMKYLGLFFQLDQISQYRLMIYYMDVMFIISCLIRFKTLNSVHVFFFLFLIIAGLILDFKKSLMMYSLINNLVASVALFVMNLIVRYMQTIRFEQTFLIIYICASIFIIIYFIYVFLYELIYITKGKRGTYAKNIQ